MLSLVYDWIVFCLVVGLIKGLYSDFKKSKERELYRNNFLDKARKYILKYNLCTLDEIKELEEDLRECESFNDMRIAYLIFEETHTHTY